MAERSQGRQHLGREALDHLEELVEASCEELQLDVAQPGVVPLPQVRDDVVRGTDRGLLEAALEGFPDEGWERAMGDGSGLDDAESS
jgi:hypothetical protein